MSRRVTKRSRIYLCRMQAHLRDALELPADRRTTALRATARHCLHLGLRELARDAQRLARVGGAT